jgi:hypothetical protein
MKGDIIPDEDHIARYCKPSKISEDGQIEFGAFMLRKDEKGLSVDWLEFLKCSSREDEIIEMRKIYPLRLTVGAKAKIAVLNVGEVCKKVQTESLDKRILKVIHEPLINDPLVIDPHSEIYNLKQDDELIAELILEIVREGYPART